MNRPNLFKLRMIRVDDHAAVLFPSQVGCSLRTIAVNARLYITNFICVKKDQLMRGYSHQLDMCEG